MTMAQNVHYSRDHNLNIGAGNLNVNNIGRDLVQNITTTDSYPHLKALHVAVAGVGASHTSEHQFARGKCLEGTRVKALQNIRRWRLSSDPSLPICWLSGSAGIGKSAIAMTVAKSCEKDGLVASFFFFRSDPKRNNPYALVPTIALGLIENIPSLRAFINQKIGERPTILDVNLEDQFQELVLDPYLQMKQCEGESARRAPNLVVIDGLDECGDEDTQMRVLSTILSPYLEKSPWSCPPLKFFICSRPEAWIREAFGREDLSRLTQRIVLNLNDANQDIEQYFRHGFQIIRTTPKYSRLRFPSPWPSEWELMQLVRMASGQFAYAATAVKFVTLAYSNPMDQLRIILDYEPGNQTSNSPFPELDRLYHVILSVNPNREKLLSVLAATLILPPYLPPSPEIIEIVLDLTPGEVDLTLRGMHSVLNIQGGWDEIRVFHTSFEECLFDRCRAGIFFIDRPAQTQNLARRWLQALSAERLRRYSFLRLFEPERRALYAKCIPFCMSISQPSQELLADLHKLEVSVVFLCRWPEIELLRLGGLTKGYPNWEEVFRGLVSWLQRSNVCDLHPRIIDRFKNRPNGFHIELSSYRSESEDSEDSADLDYFETAVVLILNGYNRWDSPTFRKLLKNLPSSFTFRVTDCRCDSDGDSPSSYRPHERYVAACLRALKALVSRTLYYYSDLTDRPMRDDVFKALVDSSLLQHCAFSAELLAQCRILFSLPTDDLCLGMSIGEIKQRRTKLLKWLETWPQCYAAETEALQLRVMSLMRTGEPLHV